MWISLFIWWPISFDRYQTDENPIINQEISQMVHEPDFSNIRRDVGDRPIGSGCGEGVGSNS